MFYLNSSKSKLLELYVTPLDWKPIIALRSASRNEGVKIKDWSLFSSRLSDIAHFLTYDDVRGLYFTLGRGAEAIYVSGQTRRHQKFLSIYTDCKAQKAARIDLCLAEINKLIVLTKCIKQKYDELSSTADEMPSIFLFLCKTVARRVKGTSKTNFNDYIEMISAEPPKDLLHELYVLVPENCMKQICVYYADAMYEHCAKNGLLNFHASYLKC